jgi:hypothetical protein
MPFGPEEWDAARPTGDGWHQKISNDSWGALHDDCGRAPRSNTAEQSSEPSEIETEQSVGFHGDTGIAVGTVRIDRAVWALWIEKNSEGQASFRQSLGKPIKEWQAVVSKVSLDNPHLPCPSHQNLTSRAGVSPIPLKGRTQKVERAPQA